MRYIVDEGVGRWIKADQDLDKWCEEGISGSEGG